MIQLDGVGERLLGLAERGDGGGGPKKRRLLGLDRGLEGVERREDSGQPRNKPMVEINATQETLQIYLGCWPREREDRIHLGRKGFDAIRRHMVSQERDGAGSKVTLGLVDGQPRGCQPGEYLADVKEVLIH